MFLLCGFCCFPLFTVMCFPLWFSITGHFPMNTLLCFTEPVIIWLSCSGGDEYGLNLTCALLFTTPSNLTLSRHLYNPKLQLYSLEVCIRDDLYTPCNSSHQVPSWELNGLDGVQVQGALSCGHGHVVLRTCVDCSQP